ncbi:hypothetical protein RC74_20835 [Falsihalocynthiibacter arcticus]|uniref:Uncharacterized protein n=1 Tax=Falsihalocynthiibacter arcticus TaxID=1579316 RepID=A0A126V4Y0_9RHOB|nr:hypothetical protein [Falsihalocynthiibacter arcticus]AML53374.1 hypothetical protein RC74_20835 [Falsihalocynthiibacter arcticus]
MKVAARLKVAIGIEPGKAKDESTWGKVLEYFEPAVQLGLTATPKRKVNADTYSYFGEPVYTYALRDGIEDSLALLGTSTGALGCHLIFDTWKQGMPAMLTGTLSAIVLWSSKDFILSSLGL